MGRRSLRESRDPSSSIPAPIGVGLLVVGSVLLTLGLVRGDDWGWTSASTVVSITAGVVVLAAFIAHQSRTARPAMDLALFESHNFRWANASTVVFGIAFSAMFLSSILFLTSVWGWSILEAGFGVAPGPLLVAVLAPRFGKLAARVGQRPLVIVGGLVYAAGGAWRLIAFDAEAAFLAAYLPSMLLTGTGVALCIPQLSSVIGQSLPPNRFGVGGAVNQALRQLGGTLGVAVTVGMTSGATGIDDALGRFDRIWWIIVAGGVLTTLLSIPLRTAAKWTPAPAASGSPAEGAVAEATIVEIAAGD
jgi:MFS family permease